jgi:hypothetical protein
MNDRKKKWTALVSVLLLVCSVLSVNASAATRVVGLEASPNSAIKVDGDCTVPDVEVLVSGVTKSYVNPNSLSFELDGSISNAQIISGTSYVQNLSQVPLSVTASVTGAIKSGSDMKLVTTSTKGSTSTAKRAFVYFQMQAVTDPDPSEVAWDTEYDASKHILVTTGTKTKKNFLTLAAAPAEDSSEETKCYGAFMMSGDCIVLPKSAWTSSDGFTATVAFTFKPLSYDTVVE